MSVFHLKRVGARALLLLPLFLVLAGCSSKIEPGTYRAVLTLPGGEVPFGLELVQEGGAWVANLVNGSKRVRVTGVQVDGGKLEMSMPGYLNHLSARMRRDRLEGEVVIVRPGGEELRLPLAATRGREHRFFEQPLTDNADLSGRWSVTFTDATGAQTPAIAEFSQKFHEISGTFLTTTGDYGHLAGEVRDEELYLSTFDGARAYLFRARLARDGRLRGTGWSGSGARMDFVAQRDEGAELADPFDITSVRDDTWTLGFTFPDENGKGISLADARFRGKVVLVALLGSWCPNSQDAAAFLAPLYRAQRERGVEVVALMFEHFKQFEQAAEAVKALRAAHQVEFPTLIAGISDKADASARFPQLSRVHAFPTTLFIDRRGRVRRIHTGFDGPATGQHYEDMIADFAATVDELAAESPPPGASTQAQGRSG